MTTQQITKIEVYWDEQDPDNIGWAYRAIVNGTEESGEVDADEAVSLEDAAIQAAHQLGLDLRGDQFAYDRHDGGVAIWTTSIAKLDHYEVNGDGNRTFETTDKAEADNVRHEWKIQGLRPEMYAVGEDADGLIVCDKFAD